ncbi:hypothetical protein K466DRAFT_568938 [Polyporus arcularius HHB13444]|uniref:F-box domain-containing protein n=1 Tax=Polyporus arcularius HHB13444 TaxID=1314778 RepID=A0A5C3NWX2_9APHY|nr:hypothetical protein K466DRAFT_568938 [Polyporus arcularius HHB13444]
MMNTSDYVSYTLLTVSTLEFFLLSADASVLQAVFALLTPPEVMLLRRVSHRIRAAVDFYSKRAWNLDSYLTRWFNPPVVHELYDRLDEHGALVSGSAVLRFLDRAPPYPNSDLDIFVPIAGLLDFGRWIQQRGYAYKPRADPPLLHFDVAALTLPSRWMVARKFTPPQYNTLMFPTLYEVFDFERTDVPVVPAGSVRPARVQIIAVEGDAREHVLTFHSMAPHTRLLRSPTNWKGSGLLRMGTHGFWTSGLMKLMKYHSTCAFVGEREYEEEWPYGGTLETFSTFGREVKRSYARGRIYIERVLSTGDGSAAGVP